MELEVIKHRDILFKDVLRAIAVKTVAWPHPLESQVRWMLDNIDDNDEHIFLKDGSCDLAYMNLVPITFIVNNTEYMAYGIGNVCAMEKGKGYGNELMRQVNAYLEEKRFAGLLFCKPALVPFYNKHGWVDIARKICDVPTLTKDIHVMTYLIPDSANRLIYHGKLF